MTRDPHASSCHISRVVLVEPALSAVAVNGLLACKTPPARQIRVDAAFADEDAWARRGPAITAACGEGIAVIAPDDGGDAVLRAFMPPTSSDAEAAVEAAFAEEDSRGRRLRCAEVTVDMSPLTKQPEQRFDDVATTALLAAARGDEADEPAVACDADDQGEPRVAALVMRGGRCILARSLQTPKAWEGMRLPSAPAIAGEDLVSGARRAIEAQLGIDVVDQTDQMAPIPNVPPLTLYRASGGATNVVFMKALQGPVEPQADAPETMTHLVFLAPEEKPPAAEDLSDDEDEYDWYTITREHSLASMRRRPVCYGRRRLRSTQLWTRASWQSNGGASSAPNWSRKFRTLRRPHRRRPSRHRAHAPPPSRFLRVSRPLPSHIRRASRPSRFSAGKRACPSWILALRGAVLVSK